MFFGATSGTTSKVPVNTALSPARASSTISCRSMTSMLLGNEPAGTSSAFSCTRTLCQSTNLHPSRSRVHLFLLPQTSLRQIDGSVYRHCCSTFGTRVPHSPHLKHPINNSGRTSDVRVTVPLKLESCPMLFAFKLRNRSTRGKLKNFTQNSFSTPPSYLTNSGRCSRTNNPTASFKNG